MVKKPFCFFGSHPESDLPTLRLYLSPTVAKFPTPSRSREMGRTKRHDDDEWGGSDHDMKSRSAYGDSFDSDDADDDDLSTGDVWREEDELKEWGDDPFSEYRDN